MNPNPKLSRRMLLAALCLVLAALFGAYQLALHQLEQAIVHALGPRASVGQIELGLSAVTVRDLVVTGAPGWPGGQELRAGTVRLQPDLGAVLGLAGSALRRLVPGDSGSGAGRAPWRLQSITVSDASLTLLRGRDGRLQVLPALLHRKPAARAEPQVVAVTAAAPAPDFDLVIETLLLKDIQLDLYDASLGRGPVQHLRLQALQAELGPLHLPALDAAIRIKLQAEVAGADVSAGRPAPAGRLTLQGQLTPASREAEITARLSGVDLRVLQAYLLKATGDGVRSGTLDLDLKASVHGQHLQAPGRVTLTGLQLAEGPGWLDHLASTPRKALLASLNRQGRIEVDFTLEGRLDDPAFSLNENLAARFASGLAEAAGVSVGGAVQGVGQLLKGLFGK